jgi:hypothetical protein
MSRKIVILNLVLASLAGTLIWQVRVQWRQAREQQQRVLSRPGRPPAVLPPAPPAPAQAPTPAEYFDVAQRTLFSPDRNPNVVVDVTPPPPPPPEKPLPPMPFYHGQMALGEPVVMLSLKGDDQKRYRAGEAVGSFKLVAFDREKITLEFEGKTVERKLAELRPKETQPVEQAAVAPAAASSPLPPVPVVKPLSATPASSPSPQSEIEIGGEMGGGLRGCAPGDNSPSGTVANGYRKVVARGLMGNTCHWEQIK